MEKYIRTYHKGVKSILKMSGCQFCPLMKFNTVENICECRYFSDKFGNSIVDPFVINSTFGGTVNDKIKPPTWCNLPNSLSELLNYRTTFKVFNGAISVDNNDKVFDASLDVIDGDTIKFEKNVPTDNFLRQVMGTPFDDDENYVRYTKDDSIKINNDFDPDDFNSDIYDKAFTYVKRYEICSSCGEEDMSVERQKNLGMCNDCWEISKNDEDKKKLSFINNFRLKRNMDISKNSIKILNDIKI